jgi:hypothetical protein
MVNPGLSVERTNSDEDDLMDVLCENISCTDCLGGILYVDDRTAHRWFPCRLVMTDSRTFFQDKDVTADNIWTGKLTAKGHTRV